MTNTNMKRGFTMIELIFVIVIIGILAAIAIPKLAATRDDAKISSDVSSLKQVVSNLGSQYTSKNKLVAADITDANKAIKCFTVAAVGGTGLATGTIKITPKAVNPSCSAAVLAGAKTLATESGLLGTAGAAKTIKFGGSKIVR